MPRTSATMELDTSRSALDFIHRLLTRPASDQPAVESLLGELASAFEVSACGLCSLIDNQHHFRHPGPTDAALPWADDPSLLERAGRSATATVIEREGQPSLLAAALTDPGGVAWVLYLEDERPFSEVDQATLALAASTLARWLPAGSMPRWAEQIDLASRQQLLETAASVSRRLAHDFGNVLTGILGFTELALAQQIPSNTPLHSYLNEVYRAAQTGAQYTHQLRLFSRRQSTSSRNAQIAAVLGELEGRLMSARDPGVMFRLHVPADLPSVAIDGEHLTQVLSALIENAREALVGPGSISISTRLIELGEGEGRELYGNLRPGPHVEVTVADTGLGLSPEVQRKLFSEPFFTTKPRRRGFGLATAYGILHAHRGGMRLHPGAEGGVVARVLLPVATVVTPSNALIEQAVRPSEKVRSERILLADDEPEVLRFIRTTLEHAGYRVESHSAANSALEAYFSAGTDPFTLVLTDVVMPGMNGVELVRRLLKRDPAARVLFVSGHVPADFTQHDFAGHGFELLSKPFRADQLLRAVRAALERPRAKGRFGKD